MILYKNKRLVIPAGLSPNINHQSVEIKNENKYVSITTNGTEIVTFDPENYTGLGIVQINTQVPAAAIQQPTSVSISDNGNYSVFPDEGYVGLSEVSVNVNVQPKLQLKIADSSTSAQVIIPDESYVGMAQVSINPYVLDEKTVDSSTNPQVITSDEDGLRQVTIRPYVLSPLEVDSSTAMQEITGQYGTVTVNPYVLDSSNAVITENGDYAFESSADGLSRVDVSVNIDTQSYYDDGYSNGKTAGIAEQKAKLDSSTFTSNGTYTREDGWNEIEVAVTTVNNQNKTVDASINSQTVTYDPGYTGLGTVTVNPYTLQIKASEDVFTYVSSDSRGALVRVKPDNNYDALEYFQYRKATILGTKTFDASTGNQTYVTNTANTYVKGINKIVINGLDLDSCYTLAASI